MNGDNISVQYLNVIFIDVCCLVGISWLLGCWQCELIRDLNIDAKSMFQHLKAFFKYDLVIR